MTNNGYSTHDCPVSHTLNLICGRWKPIILYLINNDINRFGRLKSHMPLISKKVLTEQLRDLEKDDLITRTVVTVEYPQKVIYRLTAKGYSLRKLIDRIFAWGVEHLLEPREKEGIREMLFPDRDS
jgi:DNA-binding HxlR family transcriptional regulator